jgi:tetratricopeptide (TPR) repeat protein
MATSPNFPGNPISFAALSTRAAILDKLGKVNEATAILKTALPFGNMNQLQQLGRQLITGKKQTLAMEVFQFNYNKHPDLFITLVGMARGMSAIGEKSKALEYAGKALPLAPNDVNKKAIQEMIDKLKAGEEIN